MNTMTGNFGTEFCASLRIFGVGIDFEAISTGLGVQPSDTHRVGQRGITSKPYSEDMWRLDSPLPEGMPIEAHLNWIWQALAPRVEFLASLKRHCKLSSYCGVGADDNQCRFRVPAEALRIFHELDIPMNLSIVLTGVPEQEKIPLEGAGAELKVDPDALRNYSQVYLRLVDTNLGGDVISARIGVKPLDRGGVSHHRLSSRLDEEQGGWWIPSGLPEIKGIDEHLKKLGDVFLPNADSIRLLTREAEIFFLCEIGTENDHGGIEISPASVNVMLRLNTPIEFHVLLI